LADAVAVGYAMFPSWEIREHVAGYGSGCGCKFNWNRSHVCANLWVRSWVDRISEAVWQKTVLGCRILVW